jgi:hypothetical protein
VTTGARHVIDTTAFAVTPDEDDATSYRVYGRALASFVAAKLREGGESVEEILPKPFGWCVLLRSEPFPLWIACSNRDSGTASWMAQVIAQPGLFQATLGRAAVDAVVTVYSEFLARVLPDAPGVTRYYVD